MRTGRNQLTGEIEIYLSPDEAQDMREMIRSANLPQGRTFYQLLKVIDNE